MEDKSLARQTNMVQSIVSKYGFAMGQAMTQATNLIKTLKQCIKSKGKTYADVAQALELSEASVKRLFSKGEFSLHRLEMLCDYLDITIADLIELTKSPQAPLSHFTPEQEEELVNNPKLLLMTYLVLSQWRFEDIIAHFNIDQHEAIRLLARLEKLRMIQLLPMNKIKLLTAPNFSWRKDGPIQKLFVERVQKEFLDSRFDQADEKLIFLNGRLTPKSIAQISARLTAVAREFNDLLENDNHLPIKGRYSTSAILAIRPWEFSVFQKFRKPSGH